MATSVPDGEYERLQPGWAAHVRREAAVWSAYNQHWLRAKVPLLAVRYEDLTASPSHRDATLKILTRSSSWRARRRRAAPMRTPPPRCTAPARARAARRRAVRARRVGRWRLPSAAWPRWRQPAPLLRGGPRGCAAELRGGDVPLPLPDRGGGACGARLGLAARERARPAALPPRGRACGGRAAPALNVGTCLTPACGPRRTRGGGKPRTLRGAARGGALMGRHVP